MRKWTIESELLLTALLVAVSATNGATPLGTAFTYQGVLTDDGVPADAEYDFEFRLFDALLLGVQIGGTQTVGNHDVVGGLFTVELDFGSQFTGDTRWLEVRVRDGAGNGNDPYTTLLPRQKLTGAPYALGIRLPLTTTVNTGSDAFGVINTGTGDCTQFEITNVASEGETLEVRTSGLGDNGYFEITNSASVGEAVEGRTNGAGDAIQGINTGTGLAGYFQKTNAAGSAVTVQVFAEGSGDALNIQHDGTGNGIVVAIDDTGTSNAIEAETSGTGSGVLGSNAGSGSGVAGISASGDSIFGLTLGTGSAGSFVLLNSFSSAHAVEIDSNGNSSGDALNVVHTGFGDCGTFEITNSSNEGEAVEARTSGDGDAVQAFNTGHGRAGYFEAGNTANNEPAVEVLYNGNDFALYIDADEDASGLFVDADGGVLNQLYGIQVSSGFFGLEATADIAVLGITDASSGGFGTGGYALSDVSDSYGIYGVGDAGNLAGLFDGDIEVTGDIIAPNKNFRIDHPLDPANRYLSHSCVESSERKNVYDGVVILDADGVGRVGLPNWFSVVNADFRYQLTCIGGYAPVYVSEEIAENEFTIAGGKAGLKVSWQVTGVRHDPYALAHPLQVEQDKPDHQRGKYQNPDLYGQPREMSSNYRPWQADIYRRAEARRAAKATEREDGPETEE